MPHIICAGCGTTVHTEITAEGRMMEPPDFDTRPGETARSTISTWVQQCSHCGYCSADLTHIHEGAATLLESEVYKSVLGDENLPLKARQFACYAMVLAHAGQFADAGWSTLHAAWVCDDQQLESGSTECRLRALELWKQGKMSGQNFADDLPSEFALAADLYRRAGQFEQAVVACAEALDSEDLDPGLETILRRQKSFIERRDRGRHTLGELRR